LFLNPVEYPVLAKKYETAETLLLWKPFAKYQKVKFQAKK